MYTFSSVRGHIISKSLVYSVLIHLLGLLQLEDHVEIWAER